MGNSMHLCLLQNDHLYYFFYIFVFRVEGPDAKKTACYDIDVELVSVTL